MSLKFPKKNTLLLAFILAFILACIISWIFKRELTPLLFNGLTFYGKSKYIKALFLLAEVIIFTLLLFYPSSLLINPLRKTFEGLKTKYPIFTNIKSLFNFDSKFILLFFIISSFFTLANLLMIKIDFASPPRNGQLPNNDLPELIKSAGLGESEIFATGKFSSPLEMNMIVSPEIINFLGLDIDLLKDRLQPFKTLTVDHQYKVELTKDEFESLTKTSKYRTWRQLNGNLYYYFLPIESPETYYTVIYDAQIVFVPKQLFDSLGMAN